MFSVGVLYDVVKSFLIDVVHAHLAISFVCIIVSILLFFPVSYVSSVLAYPYRFIARLFRRMGILRDHRTWGVVYDAVSKAPIDPAYVTVKGRLGTIAATAITDLDGRFGIIVPQGTYTLTVEKTHYRFPSSKLVGTYTDGYYTGLYFGGQFEVTERERAIAFAIPMDPVGDDWNQSEKERRHLNAHDRKELRWAGAIYYIVGVFLTELQYVVHKQLIAFRLLEVYSVVLVIGFVYALLKPAAYYHSVIVEKATGKSLGFARINVFSAANIHIATKISSLNGEFVCLVPNGLYTITIEKRDSGGRYSLAHTSLPFRVVDRSINRRFII